MKKFKRITGSIIASLTVFAAMPLTANAEWRQSNNDWWYSQGDSYATNWSKIDGQWYYLNTDGTMAYDTTINGYYITSNGIASSDKASVSSGTWSCH